MGKTIIPATALVVGILVGIFIANQIIWPQKLGEPASLSSFADEKFATEPGSWVRETDGYGDSWHSVNDDILVGVVISQLYGIGTHPAMRQTDERGIVNFTMFRRCKEGEDQQYETYAWEAPAVVAFGTNCSGSFAAWIIGSNELNAFPELPEPVLAAIAENGSGANKLDPPVITRRKPND